MSVDREVRQKVIGALFANALLRWETLVTLMVTAILFIFVQDVSLPFMEWQPWFWLVLGGLAEAVLVASTLTDPEATEQALAEDFEREYDLRNIRNRVSRERLRDAFEYRRNMLKLVDASRAAMRANQRNRINAINDWVAHMYSLANRIDNFENNDLAARDLQQVPRKIEQVKARIATERHEATRHDLNQQLKLLQRQLVSLEASASIIKRAEIQLESTLSALGTVYAQMSLLGTKDVNSIRGQRLGVEIQDEIDKLQDTIDAMDEVHLHGQNLGFEFNESRYLDQADAIDEAEKESRDRLGEASGSAPEDSDILAALDEADEQDESQR